MDKCETDSPNKGFVQQSYPKKFCFVSFRGTDPKNPLDFRAVYIFCSEKKLQALQLSTKLCLKPANQYLAKPCLGGPKRNIIIAEILI